MEADQEREREIRAAQNQSLFRAVNEKLTVLNEAFASTTEIFVIACECADMECAEMLGIHVQEYLAVRAEPRHFAVLPGHVYADVETVVRETERYVVVEKQAAAAAVAELLAQKLGSD